MFIRLATGHTDVTSQWQESAETFSSVFALPSFPPAPLYLLFSQKGCLRSTQVEYESLARK